MMAIDKLFKLLLINIASHSLCCAKVTDKQYAYMPELFHVDNYDKCMLLEDEALYCSFTYEVEPLNPKNASEIWKIIKEVSGDKYHYKHDHLRHSVCVPFTCPNIENSKNDDSTLRQGIAECYNTKYKDVGLKGNVTSLSCQTTENPYPVDWLDTAVAILFACYIALVMFASFYEGIFRYTSQDQYDKMISTRWGRILSALSIPKNWRKLNTVKSTAEIERLRPIQGVRFYNMLIVIWSHSALYFVQAKHLDTKHLENITNHISTMFLTTGPLSISTNFFLSSFLLTNHIFSRFEGKKEIKLKDILRTICYRYIRLTPSLITVILFYATWLRHLGTGPDWNRFNIWEFSKCRKSGWLNLLYLNNILSINRMCLPQTWYLSLEMQYFIFLLLILYFITKHPKMIWPIVGCLLTVSIVGTFVENYLNNYEAFIIPLPESSYDMKFISMRQFDFISNNRISNLVGSVAGLGFGYIYYKNRHQKLFTSNVLYHQILYYTVAYGLPLGIILLPGTYFIRWRQHDRFLASLYISLCRPIFIFGVGYLIFGTMQGLGGLTKNCLNWSPCYILGRLVYSTYLTNNAIIQIRARLQRSPVPPHSFLFMHTYFGDVCLSFIAALFLTLLVEMPASELQKLVLSVKEEDAKEKTKKK